MKFNEELKKVAIDLYGKAEDQINRWKDKVRIRTKIWKARTSHFLSTLGITAYNADYQRNPIDDKLALQCQKFIDSDFPQGLIDRLRNLSNEERLELMKNTVLKGANIMNVNVGNVKFFSPTNEVEMCTRGYYNRAEDTIYLNAYYLLNFDMPERTEGMLRTVFHELKHAVQFSAVLDDVDYGYTDELLLTWALNIKYYVDSDDNFEAYRKQPIENDAFGWAALLDTHAESI